MTNELNFEEGLEKAVQIISTFEKPIFVGIHSFGPDHGKSHLGKKLCNELYENYKIILSYQTCGTNLDDLNIEDIKEKDGCLYENGVPLFSPKQTLDLVDERNKKLFGKAIDYHIFVYNPYIIGENYLKINSEFKKEIEKAIDIIICNPNSNFKDNPCFQYLLKGMRARVN